MTNNWLNWDSKSGNLVQESMLLNLKFLQYCVPHKYGLDEFKIVDQITTKIRYCLGFYYSKHLLWYRLVLELVISGV